MFQCALVYTGIYHKAKKKQTWSGQTSWAHILLCIKYNVWLKNISACKSMSGGLLRIHCNLYLAPKNKPCVYFDECLFDGKIFLKLEYKTLSTSKVLDNSTYIFSLPFVKRLCALSLPIPSLSMNCMTWKGPSYPVSRWLMND